MYDIVKRLLFCLPPEVSHEVSLDCMGAAYRLGLLSLVGDAPSHPVTVMGIDFPNPVGLAAGLDKNGDYLNALGSLGFGFVEIGTVTPKPQSGNPEPRLFRLEKQQAIINRMGFNNKGVDHLIEQVKKCKYRGIVGINIGKNKSTPDENALFDYVYCLREAYNFADYITINISSPNTPGLRNFQFGENLKKLMLGIKTEQLILADIYQKLVPIAVKIAPDMSDDEIVSVADTLVEAGMSGIIATNTTTSREGVQVSPYAKEIGGLSGAPVKDKSTHVVRVLSEHLKGALPIIGVGGISSKADVEEKIAAGASLVQIYSGFIYRGPSLIKEAVSAFT